MANIYIFYFQRTEDADDRTPGSVSPADFFSHTPKENSNFQIPVTCGKYPQAIVLLKYMLCCNLSLIEI